ncbi:MAG TPA: hypothetical protein VFA12_04075 [Stellaceae bacterium]|nr:hypothetical protein [Stellaceae bacterium]
MDKKLAGLLGAVAGLATMASAQAAAPIQNQSEPLQASSYRDLLNPIANPVEALKADNAARAEQAAREVQLAQYYYPYYGPYYGPYPYYHHHHHHHHSYYHHHHHHHHHHGGAFIGIPGVGGVVVR